MLAVALFAAAGTGCAKKCWLCETEDEQPVGAVEPFDMGTPVGAAAAPGGVSQARFDMPAAGGPINTPVRQQGPASVAPAAMMGGTPGFGGSQ